MADALDRKSFMPQGLGQPGTPYSHVISVSCSRLVFVAGQLSVDDKNQTVGVGDFLSQARQVFKNLGLALAGVDATFEHVLKFTTFLVRPEDVGPFGDFRRELFPELFPSGAYPANTMVVIKQLPNPDWLIEVEAFAALP